MSSTMLSHTRHQERKNETLFFVEIVDSHSEINEHGNIVINWINVLKECHRENILLEVKSPRFLSRTKWPGLVRKTKMKFASKNGLCSVSKKVAAVVRKSIPTFCKSADDDDVDTDDTEATICSNNAETSDSFNLVVDKSLKNIDFLPPKQADSNDDDGLLDDLDDADDPPMPSNDCEEPTQNSAVPVITIPPILTIAHPTNNCPVYLEALQSFTELNRAKLKLTNLKIEMLQKQLHINHD